MQPGPRFRAWCTESGRLSLGSEKTLQLSMRKVTGQDLHATHAHNLMSLICQLFALENGSRFSPLPTPENQPQKR